ncbi:MAG: Dabb family protein [Actinobacteria bacterium]|uniref:Dabb family protein n=1 Tax=Microbacterium sp. NPDC076895 TaxID=3154957 RepID=UPI001003B0E7|nr:MAG: Dabb family protein [Actinomycetota bacterium]
MIRHIVFFRFVEGHDESAVQQWSEGIDGLLGAVPGLRALSHGPDILHLERSWDHALVADFDSRDALDGYGVHPAHLPLIALSATFSAQIVSVDFTVAET